MRFILNDYIASLKEERELDALVEQLLQECGFEVVFSPKKGERQYGVDIYAVGPDWEDHGKKKVFLVSVKQGNLDRKNWQGSVQGLQSSLQEIATVFIRNNILPEHKELPIKIIIAHNGTNDAAIAQNWRGLADIYPQYEFVIWQLETLVNLVEQKLINENMFSDKAKQAIRKIVIHLTNPDYDLEEYVYLLDEIIGGIDFQDSNQRKTLNQLRKVNLFLVIIISFCEKENDLRLALKASEITLLRMYRLFQNAYDTCKSEQIEELIRVFIIRKELHKKYIAKIASACQVKNGLSIGSRDAISYTFTVYEQLGFIAIAGLEHVQLAELVQMKHPEHAHAHLLDAEECANAMIHLFNNNQIVFTPRSDDQHIEISLAFFLLIKLSRDQDVEELLFLYHKELAQAKHFFNIAPVFNNDLEMIYELSVDSKKRKGFDYESSCLLAVLSEWVLFAGNQQLYDSYRYLIQELYKKIDLILWLPDVSTEQFLYTENATRKSGYSLSGITLPDSIEEYTQIILEEYLLNSKEPTFDCFQSDLRLWVMPCVASRLYRTYFLPHYWRMWIPNHSVYQKSDKNSSIDLV